MTPRPVGRSLFIARLSRLERALSACEGMTLDAAHEATLPAPFDTNATAVELAEIRAAVVSLSLRVRTRLQSVRALARFEAQQVSRRPH